VHAGHPATPTTQALTPVTLSDVGDTDNPTRLVSVRDSAHLSEATPVVMPDTDPRLYASERRAGGVRGSYLAYRSDVFHRGAPFDSEGTARFVLALAFKCAGHDWIGYDQAQSNSTAPEWRSFAEHSTPRELALFGFPAPGHPIWSEALLDEVAVRYPRLDLEPWRAALRAPPPG